MTTAGLILLTVGIWACIGALIAVPFLTFGIDRIDEDADGAYIFRPLLIPGVIVIWPLVLWRWAILARGKEAWAPRYAPRRDRHKWFGYALPIILILTIGTGLSLRQSWPDDIAPERLSEAGG
ncbi:MAG: hypothetical protein AAF919_09345 [Pseudomonadota bacterium]